MQPTVAGIVRVAFEIHLCHYAVQTAGDVEVDVRWADDVRVYRIGTRLDGDEPIAAIGIRGQFGKAIEIRVERRRVPVTRMTISPE